MEDNKRDAKSRGWRTLAQGVGAAVVVGVAAAVSDYLVPGMEVHWPTLGTVVLVAALSAVAAYAQRRVGK